jgi:hypothetical protein
MNGNPKRSTMEAELDLTGSSELDFYHARIRLFFDDEMWREYLARETRTEGGLQMAKDEWQAIQNALLEDFPCVSEPERQAAEIAKDNAWTGNVVYISAKPAWMIEAEAEHKDFLDVKFGSKQWWNDVEEIPF